jgi:hypothetical protein
MTRNPIAHIGRRLKKNAKRKDGTTSKKIMIESMLDDRTMANKERGDGFIDGFAIVYQYTVLPECFTTCIAGF